MLHNELSALSFTKFDVVNEINKDFDNINNQLKDYVNSLINNNSNNNDTKKENTEIKIESNDIKKIRNYIIEFYNTSKRKGEFANLGGLKKYITEQIKNFSYNKYNCKTFSIFIKTYFNDLIIFDNKFANFKLK